MKAIIRIFFFPCLFFFLSSQLLRAIPAYPFPIKVYQPDGSEVNILLHGDEFFSYTTTDNGYIIIQDPDGFYKYAEIDEDEKLIPGNIIASGQLKTLPANAVKADDEVFVEKIKKPALEKVLEKRLKNKSDKNTSLLKSAGKISHGNLKGLVILANFKDVKFEYTWQDFDNMLNKEGYNDHGGTGSARDYYIENSGGKFTPEFEIFGPVDLPHDMIYYGKDGDNGAIDPNGIQMIADACMAAADLVDFSDYDYDGDGIVDNIFIFYAGYNQAESGNNNTVWSHKYTLYNPQNPITIDNVILADYACTSELKYNNVTGQKVGIAGIGTFVHEFSHVLGLPDLYDADGTINGLGTANGTGVGYWCPMGYGGYLNYGRTPPYFGAMEKYLLEWTDFTVINPSENSEKIDLSPISSSDIVYRINTPTENEFFTLEVRKNEKWDAYLYGEGMLIYHIDYTDTQNKIFIYNNITYTASAVDLWDIGYTNVLGDHQCMDLLRANNIQLNDANNSKGHPFPGTANNINITDYSTPGLISWSGEKSNVEITGITRNEDTGIVSFYIKKTGSSDIDNQQYDDVNIRTAGRNILISNAPFNTNIELFDMNGKKYLSTSICDSYNINIKESGVYILKIIISGKETSHKIIIP